MSAYTWMNCKWFYTWWGAFITWFQSYVVAKGCQRCAPCHSFTIASCCASIVWECKGTPCSFYPPSFILPSAPLVQPQLYHPIALKRFDLLNWVVLQDCLLASLDSIL